MYRLSLHLLHFGFVRAITWNISDGKRLIICTLPQKHTRTATHLDDTLALSTMLGIVCHDLKLVFTAKDLSRKAAGNEENGQQPRAPEMCTILTSIFLLV